MSAAAFDKPQAFRAQWPYVAREADEISFSENDLIYIHRVEGDWAHGTFIFLMIVQVGIPGMPLADDASGR